MRTGYKKTALGVIPADWDIKTIDQIGNVTSGKRLPLGIVGIIPKELEGANLTENANRITDITCSQTFLLYVLMSPLIQNTIESIRTIGAQPKLALARIRKFRFPLPSNRFEQYTIAEALSDVDGLLEALETLIVKKQAIKKAAMQQLLTGKTRLPGFNSKWKSAALPRVAVVRKGQLMTSSNLKSGRIPVIAGGKTPAYFHAEANRVNPCVTVSASGANAGYVALHKEPIYASDCSTVEASRTFNVEFAYYWLLANQNLVYSLQAGGAQPHVQPKDLCRLKIAYPQLSEQVAIATVFSDMDAEIAALEHRRNKTRAIKRGMMQQLLTGRVRLVKPE